MNMFVKTGKRNFHMKADAVSSNRENKSELPLLHFSGVMSLL